MKAQLSFENLIWIFIVILLFVSAVYPITTTIINDYVLVLQTGPQQPYTQPLILIIQAWPIIAGIGVIALIWFFAMPKQEQRFY